MKTLRLLGMALIAILVSVNFTACSSDDEEPTKNDDGIITNQKKLVELTETNGHDTNIWSFSYDSKGRLISIVEKDYDSSNSDITNITWGENTVTESSDGESITYSLTDGLIRTGSETDGYKYSFAYNSSKQLTTYQYGDKYNSNSITLTWENGKITKTAYEDDEPSQITYSNQTCKGYFPLMVLMVEDDFKVMLAHPELIGMRVTQLPSQINSKDDYEENKDELTYTFNKDGYVENSTVVSTRIYTNPSQDLNGDGIITDDEKGTQSTDTSTTTYTFKWE